MKWLLIYLCVLIFYSMCVFYVISHILFAATVTKELKRFVADNIPEPRSGYVLAVSNPTLVQTISFATRKNVIAGQIIDHVMRGLRVKIDKLIVGLEVCVYFPSKKYSVVDYI